MSEGEVTAPGGVVYSVAASIIRSSILDSEGIWGFGFGVHEGSEENEVLVFRGFGVWGLG